MTQRTPEPARSERPQGSIPSGVRDSVTVNVARATIRYLTEHGLPPSPDNYLLAWKAVGGPLADAGARSDTVSESAAVSAEDAIRQSDMLRKTQAELLEIVRALCDSIESIAEQDGWLITQVRALRDAVGNGADRRSLAAARAMLETARQSQHDISRSRRDALGALRGLLPDLIAQMTQLGERSGEFGASLTGHLESIAHAESIEAIAEEVRHLMADAQSMSQSVERARGRLEGGARQARELEDQVARLEQELARASELLLTDHLTQAANRTGLEQAFVKAIARLADDEGVMVALLDVDDFKRVNDVMGHFAGDGVLRHLARLLQEQVRGIDTVARYGGEEFVIVMPAMTQADARDCLIKAQRELTRSVYLHEARKVFITFSAGLTAVRAADSLETALARADEGMYRSKRAGKNCVTVV
jgi:diguanylate cyclase